MRLELLLAGILGFYSATGCSAQEIAVKAPVKPPVAVEEPKKEPTLEERIKELQGKVEISPKDANLHYQLSNLYEENKQYDDVLESFKRAVENGLKAQKLPNNNPGGKKHFDLAEKLRKEKKYEEAVKEYKKAIKIDPNEAEYHNQLGFAYKNMKNYDKAIHEFEVSIQSNPTFFAPYTALGYIHRIQKNYQLSILNCKKILILNPSFTSAHYGIAFSLKELGECEEAIKHFDEYLKVRDSKNARRLREECVETLKE